MKNPTIPGSLKASPAVIDRKLRCYVNKKLHDIGPDLYMLEILSEYSYYTIYEKIQDIIKMNEYERDERRQKYREEVKALATNIEKRIRDLDVNQQKEFVNYKKVFVLVLGDTCLNTATLKKCEASLGLIKNKLEKNIPANPKVNSNSNNNNNNVNIQNNNKTVEKQNEPERLALKYNPKKRTFPADPRLMSNYGAPPSQPPQYFVHYNQLPAQQHEYRPAYHAVRPQTYGEYRLQKNQVVLPSSTITSASHFNPPQQIVPPTPAPPRISPVKQIEKVKEIEKEKKKVKEQEKVREWEKKKEPKKVVEVFKTPEIPAKIAEIKPKKDNNKRKLDVETKEKIPKPEEKKLRAENKSPPKLPVINKEKLIANNPKVLLEPLKELIGKVKIQQIENILNKKEEEKEKEKEEKEKEQKEKPKRKKELEQLHEDLVDYLGGKEPIMYNKRSKTDAVVASSSNDAVETDDDNLDNSNSNASTVTNEEEESLLVPQKEKKRGRPKKDTTIYNNKKMVYWNSVYLNNCALCSFNGVNIVSHYVYDHRQYEVFVSRVSPKLAELIKNDPFKTIGKLNVVSDDYQKIEFTCYFCLKSLAMRDCDWIEHSTKHTGEYRYRCGCCTVMSLRPTLAKDHFHDAACKNNKMNVYNDIHFDDNHLYAYICVLCNYVQMKRVNMERHLRREHLNVEVSCVKFSIVNFKVDSEPIEEEREECIIKTLSEDFPNPAEMLKYEIVNNIMKEDYDDDPLIKQLLQLENEAEDPTPMVQIPQITIKQEKIDFKLVPSPLIVTIKNEPEENSTEFPSQILVKQEVEEKVPVISNVTSNIALQNESTSMGKENVERYFKSISNVETDDVGYAKSNASFFEVNSWKSLSNDGIHEAKTPSTEDGREDEEIAPEQSMEKENEDGMGVWREMFSGSQLKGSKIGNKKAEQNEEEKKDEEKKQGETKKVEHFGESFGKGQCSLKPSVMTASDRTPSISPTEAEKKGPTEVDAPEKRTPPTLYTPANLPFVEVPENNPPVSAEYRPIAMETCVENVVEAGKRRYFEEISKASTEKPQSVGKISAKVSTPITIPVVIDNGQIAKVLVEILKKPTLADKNLDANDKNLMLQDGKENDIHENLENLDDRNIPFPINFKTQPTDEATSSEAEEDINEDSCETVENLKNAAVDEDIGDTLENSKRGCCKDEAEKNKEIIELARTKDTTRLTAGKSTSRAAASSSGAQSTATSSSGRNSGNNAGTSGGSGGDDGDKNRPNEKFVQPLQIKVEEEEKEEKEELQFPKPVLVKVEPEEENIFQKLVENCTKMEHVGFAIYEESVWHLCLIPECEYTTDVAIDMNSHAIECHSDEMWDGYCHPCEAHVSDMDNCTILNEVKHMLNVHARMRNQVASVSAQVERPMLKVRMLEGDILSNQEAEATSAQLLVPRPLVVKQEQSRLKPWTNSQNRKTGPHCDNMLEIVSLFALFKCMGQECCYTTTQKEFMEEHIDNHEKKEIPDKIRTRNKSWLECAYCDEMSATRAELINHIVNEHADSGFQCRFCFYRSRDPVNVDIHLKRYHPREHKSAEELILVMNENVRKVDQKDMDYMSLCRRQNILSLDCGVCHETFYILSDFMVHLNRDHKSHNYTSCQICSVLVEPTNMAKHLLSHKIGLFECIYCMFGDNTKAAILDHISQYHSSKPMYCCIRHNKKDYIKSDIESLELHLLTYKLSDKIFRTCELSYSNLNYKTIDLKNNATMQFPTHRTVVRPPQRKQVPTPSLPPPLSQLQMPPSRNIDVATPQQVVVVQPQVQPVIPLQVPATLQAPQNHYIQLIGDDGTTTMYLKLVDGFSLPTTTNDVSAQSTALPVISNVQGALPVISNATSLNRVQQPRMPIISCVQGATSYPVRAPVISNIQAVNLAASSTLTPPASITSDYQSDLDDSRSTNTPLATSAPVSAPPSKSPVVTTTSAPVPAKPAIASSSKPVVTSKPAPREPSSRVKSLREKIRRPVYVDNEDSDSSASSKQSSRSEKSNKSSKSRKESEKRKDNDDHSIAKPGGRIVPNDKAIKMEFLFDGEPEFFNEVDEIACEIIKDTGLAREELYPCCVRGCHLKFPDYVKFNLHLVKHAGIKEYECRHCTTVVKVAADLTSHLKQHGRHRYFCFACDHKGPILPDVIKHMKEKHYKENIVLSYLHPKKRDIHNDIVVVCPENVLKVELKNYLKKIQKIKSKLKTEIVKKFFAPTDVDILPPEYCFKEEVYCSACEYHTKNRRNMKLHLERHLKPDEDVLQSVDTENANIPKYVQESHKYLCGAKNCSYLLQTPDLFHTHLINLHSSELNYKCPHCNIPINDGQMCFDSIMKHLQLHGATLFKCSHCDFTRSIKTSVENHITKEHTGTNVTLVTLRAPSEGSVGTGVTEWQCDLCDNKCLTKNAIENHMLTEHKVTSQYKCSKCSYRSNSNDSFNAHFVDNHPESDPLIISFYHPVEIKKQIEKQNDAASSSSSEVRQPAPMTAKSRAVGAYLCGMAECTYTNNSISIMPKHFRTMHGLTKSVVFKNVENAKLIRKKFDHFIKYLCYHCEQKCDSVENLSNHWREIHKDADLKSSSMQTSKYPFLFKICKLVECFHCYRISTFKEITNHAWQAHPEKSFACFDARNLLKCGECDFIVEDDRDELLSHTQKIHTTRVNTTVQKKTYDDPYDYLDKRFLDSLLQLNSKHYKCKICATYYDTVDDMSKHCQVSHSGIKNYVEMEKPNTLAYICSCCNEKLFGSWNVAKHMRTHLAQYNCRYCRKEFKCLKSLKQHQENVHTSTDTNFVKKDPENYSSIYKKLKVVFKNGFTVSKEDLRNTKYGSLDDIFKLTRDMNDEEIAMINAVYYDLKNIMLNYKASGEIYTTDCQNFLDYKPRIHLVLDDEKYDKETYYYARDNSRSRKRKFKFDESNSDYSDDDSDGDWMPEMMEELDDLRDLSNFIVEDEEEVDEYYETSTDDDFEVKYEDYDEDDEKPPKTKRRRIVAQSDSETD